MRIKKRVNSIDYNATGEFFKHRAEKYDENNPYSVTMYQDNNPDLVNERNKAETMKLLPFLELDNNSRVLDLACGIGRWSDVLPDYIRLYYGIDFSPELIQIAEKRNKRKNAIFKVGSISRLGDILDKEESFSDILIIGALMYLNDADVENTFVSLMDHCAEHSVICIREPIGIDERLTLKDHYSSELSDNYNAIYRTRDELIRLIEKPLSDHHFHLKEEDYLFEGQLNNRKETSQYYFIFKR